APLKETLAAGVLALAGWGEQEQPVPLLDPMCGSGTLLIEGVMMALGLPVGLWRPHFGFERWLCHDAVLWQSLRQQAESVRDRRLSAPQVLAWGYDRDADVIGHARANAERLGMAGFFHFSEQVVQQVQAPRGPAGLLVTNPPYGERLGSLTEVSASYRQLGDVLRTRFAGWRFALI